MKYELVCGLEIHSRVKTKSKLWCSCTNDIFGKNENSTTCPICTGFPGQLPVLNKEVLKKAIKTGKALNCKINNFSKFDRKSYFYPDLPNGFQTTQNDEPICGKGKVEIYVNGEKKSFGIERIHIENDAGKLAHSGTGTKVDLNRAGCPLMEIVTDPDFRSIEEVKAFLQEMQKILRSQETSDADMEKGQFRADVNVSLRPFGQKEFGVRTELKNMNSFSAIEKAMIYEYKRQAKALDNGEKMYQETRGWDEGKGISVSQRSKEEAKDYRFFPEPDLPLVDLEQSFIDEILRDELPIEKFERLQKDFGIKKDDAFIFSGDLELCNFFEKVCEISKDPKKSSSWILSEFLGFLKEDNLEIKDSKVSAENLAKIILMINDGEISGKIGKEVFEEVYKTGKNPEKIVDEKGLKQNSNTDELKEICQKVLDEKPDLVEKYKGGKDNLLGAFVGGVMKATGGKANPGLVNKILKELLG